MAAGTPSTSYSLNFFMCAILLYFHNSQIFEIFHIFKAFTSYLYIVKYPTIKQNTPHIQNSVTWKCLHATTRNFAAAAQFNAIYKADFIQTFHAHFRTCPVVFEAVISCEMLS
jgi:hypothetical protein